MPEKVTLNEQRGIIEVLSYGVVTKQDMMDTIETGRKIIDAKGINKVLVDTRQQTLVPDPMDVIDLFTDFPQGLKMAMLISENQPTLQNVMFLKTAALNRFFSFEVFSSQEQAIAWLNK